MDELDRRGSAEGGRLCLGPRAEEHEHGAKALATGPKRRAGVARESVSVSLDQLAEPLLDGGHQDRQPGLGLIHHLRDGRGHCGAVHGLVLRRDGRPSGSR